MCGIYRSGEKISTWSVTVTILVKTGDRPGYRQRYRRASTREAREAQSTAMLEVACDIKIAGNPSEKSCAKLMIRVYLPATLTDSSNEEGTETTAVTAYHSVVYGSWEYTLILTIYGAAILRGAGRWEQEGDIWGG